jgi:hypothetical protein
VRLCNVDPVEPALHGDARAHRSKAASSQRCGWIQKELVESARAAGLQRKPSPLDSAIAVPYFEKVLNTR